MKHLATAIPSHPVFSRRSALQAGAIELLGLGMNHLALLRALSAPAKPRSRARAVIYIFLSGGLAQLDSFDPKPDAPAEIRGEFQAIATRTPGIRICEHLPRLAQRSHLWALCRSLTHPYNAHSQGHLAMLTGLTPLPPGFDASKPKPTDWPSLAAVANQLIPRRNNLPPAVILAYAGARMGHAWPSCRSRGSTRNCSWSRRKAAPRQLTRLPGAVYFVNWKPEMKAR